MLREVGGEILDTKSLQSVKPTEIDPAEFRTGELPLKQYRSLVLEFQQTFAQNAITVLESFLTAPEQTRLPTAISDQSQEILFGLRKKYTPSTYRTWALNPENWFLVETEHSAAYFHSRVAAQFPCSAFPNGPLACSSYTNLDVKLEKLDHIINQTGLEQLWSANNFGQETHVSILDTGVSTQIFSGTESQLRAVGNLSPNDIDGHGTAVYELIKSVAPMATIDSLCILQEYSGGQIWNLIQGFTEFFGVRDAIINTSVGVPQEWVAQLPNGGVSFEQSMNNILMALNANQNICVSAAGNDGVGRLRWPAASTEVLAVGSNNEAFKKSSFSNYVENGKNFILSPGGDYRRTDGFVSSLGRYGLELSRDLYGTSFSCAITSGILALLQRYDWFRGMNTRSKISLIRNNCARNEEGFPLFNVDDIGAIWPLG